MAIFIEGIGNVPIVQNEYTHPDVATEFRRQLAVLTDVFGRRPSVTEDDPNTVFSAEDHDRMVNAISALQNLAQNGLSRNIVLGDSSSPVETYFLTTQMATNLDLVVRSLKLAGITVPPTLGDDGAKKAAVINWIDLAGFGVAEILQSAVNAALSNRSLQSLIELEFVKTGNDLIFQSLQDLEEALSLTKDVLDTLERVQDLRNKVTVKDVPTLTAYLSANYPFLLPDGTTGGGGGSFSLPFPIPVPGGGFTVGGDGWVTRFSTALANYIKLVVPDVAANPTSIAYQILAVKATLSSKLLALARVSPENTRNTPGTLAANLNALIGAISKVFSSKNGAGTVVALGVNSPATSLMRAAKDFLLVNVGEEQLLSDVFKGIRGQGFDLDSAISTAITSGESLNDTQKQDIRRFLFIFEEFYKSASAVLTKISQLLEKFAQNIAR